MRFQIHLVTWNRDTVVWSHDGNWKSYSPLLNCSFQVRMVAVAGDLLNIPTTSIPLIVEQCTEVYDMRTSLSTP